MNKPNLINLFSLNKKLIFKAKNHCRRRRRPPPLLFLLIIIMKAFQRHRFPRLYLAISPY